MAFLDDGFFHALQQEPDDDTLRLVFADFLEDRGEDATLAWAELIRLQIRLARESNEELLARQSELLSRWQRVWLGDRANLLHGWTFRRGLVEAVSLDAADFLDHAADLFADWPTLGVAKLTGAAEYMPELAACPWLAHLRGLDLSDNCLDSETLAHLTSSRFVSLLQALDLSGNPIGPRGAGLLAAMGSADDLVELHLAGCGLWHEGMLALLGSRPDHRVRWRRLDLSDNGIYRQALARLVNSPLMRNLEALDLSGNPLGSMGASVLAESPSSRALADLGLCNTESGESAVAALARGARNLPNLQSLDLRGHECFRQVDSTTGEIAGLSELARSPLLGQLRRLLLARPGPRNGWPAQILGLVRPTPALERTPGGWVARLLRSSPYLIPSRLIECDVEELWWLGDTLNRERAPTHLHEVLDVLGEYPELLDGMDRCEVAVLRLRYGLDESPLTLKEIGERLDLPRDHVRQVEKEALGKLWVRWKELPFQ